MIKITNKLKLVLILCLNISSMNLSYLNISSMDLRERIFELFSLKVTGNMKKKVL